MQMQYLHNLKNAIKNNDNVFSDNKFEVSKGSVLQSGFLSSNKGDLKLYTRSIKDIDMSSSVISQVESGEFSVFINKQHLFKITEGYYNPLVDNLFSKINRKECSIKNREIQFDIVDLTYKCFNCSNFAEWAMLQSYSAIDSIGLEYLLKIMDGFYNYVPSSVKKETWIKLVRLSENSRLASPDDVSVIISKKIAELKRHNIDLALDRLLMHLIRQRGLDEALMDLIYMLKTIFGSKHGMTNVV